MSKTFEQEQFEEDRLNLLHKMVHYAEIDDWERVKKYEELYRKIYGDLPAETRVEVSHSPKISTGSKTYKTYGVGA